MRWKILALAVFATALSAVPRPATAVDLALVLLTDVSRSMDDGEYALVKEGYRAAFADSEVVAALIGNDKGVAVTYVEFSGHDEIEQVIGWQVLTGAASAHAFGEAIAAAPRSSAGNTALAAALAEASRLLLDGDFGAALRVIDITSDHPSDGGRSAAIRDVAVANGITINALPIIDDRPIGTVDGQLTYSAARRGHETVIEYYLRNVVGGPGSFAIEARSIAVFGEALKRKLLLELIAEPPADTDGAVFKATRAGG
ncbi:MAG: DUF1194 domain-containing protein [Kiloniellaceae bacterium]